MTIHTNNLRSEIQQQATPEANHSVPTASNPEFRRKYSSTFSHIDWPPTGSVAFGSTTPSTVTSVEESVEMPPPPDEILPDIHRGKVVILSVSTKGVAPATKTARKIDTATSYLKLKEEHRKRRERSQPQQPSSLDDQFSSRKSVIGSFPLSVQLPFFRSEKAHPPPPPLPKQQQQQSGSPTSCGKETKDDKKKKYRRTANKGSGAEVISDIESTGSVKQIMQESEGRAAKRRNPLWNLVSDLTEISTDSLQQKQVSGMMILAKKSSLWSKMVLLVVSIVVGFVISSILMIALMYFFHARKSPRNDEQSLYNSTHQQEMLELAEKINIACGDPTLHLRSRSSGGGGGVKSMSTCQALCHNNMCCVEQDGKYSCKTDIEKECALYAGCLALIEDDFNY